MKNLKALIDTNIAYTVISHREDLYADESYKIMQLCISGDISGYLAFHSLSNIWYVSRKFTDDERRDMIISLCDVLTVVGVSNEEVKDAVYNREFKDFEDCLQDKCAKAAACDFIITANVKDFKNSEIPAISPSEFLILLQGGAK